ncbi:MAG: hypothetical protein JNG90_02300, partial [Planctomycetaceae bacterium]|nr:hypothetical protein [Planctomycetaceae bacterium]
GVGQDSVESILPRGITAGLLDQTGATRANFRCRVHLGLGRDRVLAAADPFAADTWRTVYEATIWRAADGEIRLLKQESASDSAPSAAPAGNPAEWSPPPLDGQPARPAGDLPANPAPPGPASAPPANPSSGRSGMNRTPLTFPPSR